ncbi:HNH endonuclease signature motif containing protein [Saccharopolyspora shandongensis]|uniref:HNH endonuclease n=1 Tax=Saccharopolyspora shandongensis TaxID=418495 RepID=UPI0033F7404B
MRQFDTTRDYYALTLGATRRGQPFWSAYSHWVGWSTRHPKWEMREASIVAPEWISNAWKTLGEPWVSVHDDRQFAVFMRIGGNMLVEKEFADLRLPHEVGPKECAPDGSIVDGGGGFVVTEELDNDAAMRRAPTRKLRGQVLKRDDYRCVICGRRARDHVDLELHVHHVIPWRMGGPTTETNLVTLCGTCHKGLDPDYQPQIRELANLPGRATPLDRSEHHAEVERYRAFVERVLAADDNALPAPEHDE